jgi:drug/metabolite transporter (DMT)-like permease
MSPYLWMLAGSFSFATMAALSRTLAVHSDWRLLALVRAGLMLALALPWALATRAPLAFPGSPMLWMRSLVGSLGMLATFYSISHLPVSEAVTLLNIYPIWVALLAVLFGERVSRGSWIAIAVGVAGVACVARPQFESSRLALAVALGSSVCTSVVLHGLSRLSRTGTWAVIVHFAVVSTAVTGAVFAAGGESWSHLDPGTTGRRIMVLAVGLTATLGQFALTRAFAAGAPSRVSVVGLMQLVFGGIYDALLFGRRHGALTLLGMALVAAPTAWLLARRRGPAAPAPAADPGPSA